MAWYDSIIGEENAKAVRAAYNGSSLQSTVDSVSDAADYGAMVAEVGAKTVGNAIEGGAKQAYEAGLGIVDDVQAFKAENEYNQRNGTAWYNAPEDTPLPEGYKGNIDLNARKVYKPEGKDYIQTEESFGYGVDPDTEVLLARIVGGKRVTKKEAVDHFLSSGEHLGVYERNEGESDEEFYGRTDAEASKIHDRQAKYYRNEMPAEGTLNPSAGDQAFAATMEPNGMEDQSATLLAAGLGRSAGAYKAATIKGGARNTADDIVNYSGVSRTANANKQWADDMAKYEANLASTSRGMTARDVEIVKQKTAGLANDFAANNAAQAAARVARPTGPVQLSPQQQRIMQEMRDRAAS